MNEVQSGIIELAQELAPVPDGIDLPTAIIARVEPKILRSAILEAHLQRAGLSMGSLGQEADGLSYQSLEPRLDLAKKVEDRQYSLTKKLRWLSTIGIAAGLGLGVTGLLVAAEHENNVVANQIAESYNITAPQSARESIMPTGLDGEQLAGALGYGVVASVAGAAAALAANDRLEGRAARKRARRIIKRTA